MRKEEYLQPFEFLNSDEKRLILDFIDQIKMANFIGDVIALVVGGTVTCIHNKPVEDQDLDIIINFSSHTRSEERLADVRTGENTVKSFLEENEIDYLQHAGLLGLENFKGWALIESEYEGEVHQIIGLLDNFPQIRFTTEKQNGIRPLDIMISGVNQPTIPEHLKWQEEQKKGYVVLYNTPR
jgi:hypothetical protein